MNIQFDENFEMTVSIKQQPEEVFLILSDSLMAIDENLTISYKEKLLNFILKSDKWYSPFKYYILEWGRKEYNTKDVELTVCLINIFVLFEQEEAECFGLEYGVTFDEEHNCGIKVKMNNQDFEIYEIGTGDVAFS